MDISSSFLHRYLTEFRHLAEIVREGFGFRPCDEEMAFAPEPIGPFGQSIVFHYSIESLAICFTDLPVKQSGDHRDQYGQYAIVMTKNWAIENGVTPVRYYHENSPFQADEKARQMLDALASADFNNQKVIDQICCLLKEAGEDVPSSSDMEALPESIKKLHDNIERYLRSWLEHFRGMYHLTRVYRGQWQDRVTKQLTERTLYDEREWRAISSDPTKRLRFLWRDVEAIVVTNEKERAAIGEMVLEAHDQLQVEDGHLVWSKIHIAEQYYACVT